MVVLFLEIVGILRYVVFHITKKEQTTNLSACVSSFDDFCFMVDRHQMGTERFHILPGHGEQFHSRFNVYLLRSISAWPACYEIPLVEEVPYYVTIGNAMIT